MRKANVTILASIFVMALVASVVGVGTQAWFSSTRKVGPTITAGNVDLRLSKTYTGGYDTTLNFAFPTGFAPGDSFTILVYLKNVGNAGSRTVWVYGDGLSDVNGLSDVIYISEVTFTDSTTYSPSGWTTPPMSNYITRFGDGVGQLTLREFATANLESDDYMRFYWGKWGDRDYLVANSGSVEAVQLTFKFIETAGNEYQNLQCAFNIVFRATDEQGYGLIWPL